jgi:hypothetical protein
MSDPSPRRLFDAELPQSFPSIPSLLLHALQMILDCGDTMWIFPQPLDFRLPDIYQRIQYM